MPEFAGGRRVGEATAIPHHSRQNHQRCVTLFLIALRPIAVSAQQNWSSCRCESGSGFDIDRHKEWVVHRKTTRCGPRGRSHSPSRGSPHIVIRCALLPQDVRRRGWRNTVGQTHDWLEAWVLARLKWLGCYMLIVDIYLRSSWTDRLGGQDVVDPIGPLEH